MFLCYISYKNNSTEVLAFFCKIMDYGISDISHSYLNIYSIEKLPGKEKNSNKL